MNDAPYTPTPGCKCPACMAQLPPPELTGDALIEKLKAILVDTAHKSRYSVDLLEWVSASLVYVPLPAPIERAMLQWGVDRYNVDRRLWVTILDALTALDPSHRAFECGPELTVEVALAVLAKSRAAAIRIATERGGITA